MKIEASYSFVNNRLMLFVFARHQESFEKKYTESVQNYMSLEISRLQEDLDNSFFMLEYNEELIERIKFLFTFAFRKTEEHFHTLKLELEIKQILGTD